jgi:hypothetical protein
MLSIAINVALLRIKPLCIDTMAVIYFKILYVRYIC